ncbi:MAG TPA: redox-sensitive transcriptional activator SoxR [Jiangellaceae bacterium]|jgi:MerR family redox-sensitive transcriptional activator SoxR|nr:redox-sensitive transcriptional activator SoxR [Jiangellaceae bacterium]
MAARLTIGDLASRSGASTSALRFYEAKGLLSSARTSGGHRVYERSMLRRVAFVRAAQRVGLSLEEIRRALDTLPSSRTPTAGDWTRLSQSWQGRLDQRIAELQRLRDELGECIGCGCLSLTSCHLYNPDDRAAVLGTGPRYLWGDQRPRL